MEIDGLFESLDKAMILGGLVFAVLLLIGAIGCRMYEFFFPDKRPSPWEDGWGEEETPLEDEEVGSQPNDRSSNDADII